MTRPATLRAAALDCAARASIKAMVPALALALALGLAFASAPALAQGGELIERTSPHSVDETVERLTAAIENAGATHFATVPHAKGAERVGLELTPSALVIFGNPNVGTPIMQENIRAGLDLPIRVLVFSEDGETRLATLAPSALAARYGVDAEEALGKMEGAINNLMAAAAKE